MADVLIVGGGLNGPVLALALARAGLSVTVVDALPLKALRATGFDGRAYALALASQRMLAALDLWDAVSGDAQPINGIRASDGRAGEGASPFFLAFDAAEIEEGPMGYMLEDRFLRRALLDAMKAEDRISHVAGRTVTAQEIDPQGVTVTLSDGKTLRARLIVGADGRRSGTAERAGITRTGWGYGQTALVAAIDHALPHGGIAHQFFMPPGPLAILPLPGNRSSIVWSESDAQAQAIMALDDAGFLDVLRPRFGSFLGEISLAGQRFTYPLNLTLANSFVAERRAGGMPGRGRAPGRGHRCAAGSGALPAMATVRHRNAGGGDGCLQQAVFKR